MTAATAKPRRNVTARPAESVQTEVDSRRLAGELASNLRGEVRFDAGSRTLKDAINEAMRDWVANVTDTAYILGSALGPHPYPLMVREFQSVIGREAREQMLDRTGRLPDLLVAAIGGELSSSGTSHRMPGLRVAMSMIAADIFSAGVT